MNSLNEIILYQPDSAVQLEVRLENETVWLTQAQIAALFGVDRSVIGKHLKNVFTSRELSENSVCAIFAHTAKDGKLYNTRFYNLDAILSVGYRVNSINATQFRQWANRILKEYLLKGYAVNQRFERLEQRVAATENKIDFFVKTALPPVEGILFDGQIFDAYVFAADLIKSAKKSLVLIDNYIDESVLLLFAKRAAGVVATIYTAKISAQLQKDLDKHCEQYPPIELRLFKKSHDRFLIIDHAVYHLGASLKDLGKRWFAFSKMEWSAADLLQRLT
ncbi:MAG: virulence RhuM family protein [Planctomycetota bacterium]|jgi:hypothetical protein|nr:virulence RhuM family protein [Planctomycetota bacterium]